MALRTLELRAPAPLAAHVECVWRMWGDGGRTEPVFPDVAAAEVLLVLGDDLVLDGRRVRGDSRVVVGARLGTYEAVLPPRLDVLAVRLRPACTCLLGAPVRAVRGAIAPLEVVSPALDRRLASVEGPSSLVRALAPLLAGPCRSPLAPVAERLVASGGATPIAALSSEVGVSRRHLGRAFHDALGVSPKTFARVARFARAWKAFGAARPPSWAGAAADLGFADQSHLIREFRAFAGGTPDRLFAPGWYEGVVSHPSNPGRAAVA